VPASHIKESKLDNGMVGLEITYGGREAPFGGLDASAPPMYIDRNCFSNIQNFGVFDEQLVALSYVSAGINLQSWPANVIGSNIKFGTYCNTGSYYNWVLCWVASPLQIGPPEIQDVTFYIWVWAANTTGNIPLTTSTTIRQVGVLVPATAATASLIVEGQTATVTGSVAVTVGGGSTATITINIGDTPATVASNIAAAINALGAGFNASAVVDSGFSNQVNLTYLTTGTAGNNASIIIGITQGGGGTVPITAVYQGFSGGVNTYYPPFGAIISPISWVQVGESLYFSGGGGGSGILQFTFTNSPPFVAAGPVLRQITQYLGAVNLGKFNNQLIAVGVTPGPGQVFQASEMTIAWSASGAFGIWNPLFSNGNTTGAGFNQITDISDVLTGMLIGSGMAVILRTQGIDYITPLTGGVVPFDFQHISNALKGEGCQDSQFLTQYDQMGFFIGNTNIYEFANGLNAIGHKVTSLIFSSLNTQLVPTNRGALSGPFFSGIDTNVIVQFLIGSNVFTYDPDNKTWTKMGLVTTANISSIAMMVTKSFANLYTNTTTSYNPALMYYTGVGAPTFWLLSPTIQNSDFPLAPSISYIVFPQEEIEVGRDITIDGVLITASGVPGQVITLGIRGYNSNRDGSTFATPITGTVTLPSTAVFGVFQNYQVYFNTSTNDKFTVQNPEVHVNISTNGSGVNNPLSISKVVLFGSYDPNQRPV
jgi:hypothetical protein